MGARRGLATGLRLTVRVAAPALGLCLIAGCSGSDGVASADCASALRLDGTVYVEVGSTRHRAGPAGRAERSECHDVGRDPPGSVFPDEPDLVRVVAFDGLDPEEVLGVREDGRYRVFVADVDAGDQVLERLTAEKPPQRSDGS